jgi:DNA-binding XRE family transcriptional regulator
VRVYAGGMYNAVRELSAALASHVGMTRQSINAIGRGQYDPNHVWPLAKYHSYC